MFKEVDVDFAKKVEHKEQESILEKILRWLFGNTTSESRGKTIDIFTWILAIAGISTIIWLLTRTEFTSFLKGNSKKTAFNFADINEDISTINFDERITKATSDNDFRLAIRWHYLKLLNELNEKRLIQYEPFKTNIDYSLELSKSNGLEKFKNCSNIYDYVWYGNYSIDITSYEKMKHQFDYSIN